MASEPRTSTDPGPSGAGSGSEGGDGGGVRVAFGRAVARRVRPRQRLGHARVGRAAGDVVRRSVEFANVVGVSALSRWAHADAAGEDVGHLSVRPPIDAWPSWWDADDELDAPPVAVVRMVGEESRGADPRTPRAAPGDGTASWGTAKLDALAEMLGVAPPVPDDDDDRSDARGSAAPSSPSAAVSASSTSSPLAKRAEAAGDVRPTTARRRPSTSPGQRIVRRGLPIASARPRPRNGRPGGIVTALRAREVPVPERGGGVPRGDGPSARRQEPRPRSATTAHRAVGGGFASRVPSVASSAVPRDMPDETELEELPPDIQTLRERLLGSGLIQPDLSTAATSRLGADPSASASASPGARPPAPAADPGSSTNPHGATPPDPVAPRGRTPMASPGTPWRDRTPPRPPWEASVAPTTSGNDRSPVTPQRHQSVTPDATRHAEPPTATHHAPPHAGSPASGPGDATAVGQAPRLPVGEVVSPAGAPPMTAAIAIEATSGDGLMRSSATEAPAPVRPEPARDRAAARTANGPGALAAALAAGREAHPTSAERLRPAGWREHGVQWRWRLAPPELVSRAVRPAVVAMNTGDGDAPVDTASSAPGAVAAAVTTAQALTGDRGVDGAPAPARAAQPSDLDTLANVTDLSLRRRPLLTDHPAGRLVRTDELAIVRRLPTAIDADRHASAEAPSSLDATVHPPASPGTPARPTTTDAPSPDAPGHSPATESSTPDTTVRPAAAEPASPDTPVRPASAGPSTPDTPVRPASAGPASPDTAVNLPTADAGSFAPAVHPPAGPWAGDAAVRPPTAEPATPDTATRPPTAEPATPDTGVHSPSPGSFPHAGYPPVEASSRDAPVRPPTVGPAGPEVPGRSPAAGPARPDAVMRQSTAGDERADSGMTDSWVGEPPASSRSQPPAGRTSPPDTRPNAREAGEIPAGDAPPASEPGVPRPGPFNHGGERKDLRASDRRPRRDEPSRADTSPGRARTDAIAGRPVDALSTATSVRPPVGNGAVGVLARSLTGRGLGTATSLIPRIIASRDESPPGRPRRDPRPAPPRAAPGTSDVDDRAPSARSINPHVDDLDDTRPGRTPPARPGADLPPLSAAPAAGSLHRDDLPTIRRSTVLADTDIATDSGTAELPVRPAAPGTAPAVARSAPGTERRWLDTAADVPTAALSALGTAADTARAARPAPASVTAAAVADTAPAVVPGTASRAPVSLNPQHSLERATAAEARGTDPYTEPADERGTSRPAPAETFAAELARHRTERPRAIPVTYRPLVAAIVGNRPVQVSTGVASRRALAKVGKIAATTGDTIHLASPTPPPDVIAHELTHVAHPSPVARFFDDDDHSPEEQRAEQVAAIMRRAPILPRTAAATPSVTAAPGRPRVAPATNVVRRSPASATVQPTPTGSISAAALAEQITQGASGVQRVIGGHRRGRAQTVPDTSSVNAPSSIQVPAAPLETIDDRDDAPTATGPDLATQFEYILELLEERVLRELERRGGRFRGGF